MLVAVNNYLVDSGETEGILWAVLVEVGVVDTHSPVIILLPYEDWVSQLLTFLNARTKAGARNEVVLSWRATKNKDKPLS